MNSKTRQLTSWQLSGCRPGMLRWTWGFDVSPCSALRCAAPIAQCQAWSPCPTSCKGTIKTINLTRALLTTVKRREPDVRFGKPDKKASGYWMSGFRTFGSLTTRSVFECVWNPNKIVRISNVRFINYAFVLECVWNPDKIVRILNVWFINYAFVLEYV